MIYTLFTFYRSREWADLCAQIKQERVNADGELICVYCGKPIVKAYDCICHHREYLTEENVNDLTVSLNPENIDLVHHRCHNYIHNKFGFTSREVFLVYGPPMAGKTSFVRTSMTAGDLVVDVDDIWQCVTGGPRYVKPAQLKSVVFRVRDTLLDCVKYRQGRWQNAYVVGGYPFASDRERLIRELGAREVFLDVPKEECILRLDGANDGRDVKEWRGYIEEWFDRYGPG